MEVMGWDDLNWLEDVHMGYEDGNPAVFDRNNNGSSDLEDIFNFHVQEAEEKKKKKRQVYNFYLLYFCE